MVNKVLSFLKVEMKNQNNREQLDNLFWDDPNKTSFVELKLNKKSVHSVDLLISSF